MGPNGVRKLRDSLNSPENGYFFLGIGDPNGIRNGRVELSGYMNGFQQSVPGGSFRIIEVVAHNGRSLAHWALEGADGAILQLGASFATHDNEGRLKQINGFFPLTRAGSTE